LFELGLLLTPECLVSLVSFGGQLIIQFAQYLGTENFDRFTSFERLRLLLTPECLVSFGGQLIIQFAQYLGTENFDRFTSFERMRLLLTPECLVSFGGQLIIQLLR
jgi:hypothetical protein